MRGIAQPQFVEFGLKRLPLFCLELKLGLEGGGGLFPGVVSDPPYMDTNIGFNHADCGLHRRRRWGRTGPLDEYDLNRDTGGFGGLGLGGHPQALSRAGDDGCRVCMW